jgi:hypothetical protein
MTALTEAVQIPTRLGGCFQKVAKKLFCSSVSYVPHDDLKIALPVEITSRKTRRQKSPRVVLKLVWLYHFGICTLEKCIFTPITYVWVLLRSNGFLICTSC